MNCGWCGWVVFCEAMLCGCTAAQAAAFNLRYMVPNASLLNYQSTTVPLSRNVG